MKRASVAAVGIDDRHVGLCTCVNPDECRELFGLAALVQGIAAMTRSNLSSGGLAR
jgi:hypothetical protein